MTFMLKYSKHKKFNRQEYYRLAEIGILKHSERVELIEGIIFNKYTSTHRLFTQEEFETLKDVGLIKQSENVALINGELICQDS